MAFFISAPLLEIIRVAAVTPQRINDVMEARLVRGDDAMMRPGHHYPSTIARRTGIPVVGISRRNRHLLVTVESRQPFWIYREYSRNACSLSIPIELPETVKAAAAGQCVNRLLETKTAIDKIRIVGIAADRIGWTELELAPEWVRC